MITLAAATLLLCLGVFRLRYAAMAFIFFLPFIPRSLGLILESSGASLSFSRLGIVILAFSYILQRVQAHTFSRFHRFDPLMFNLFWIMLLLVCIKLLSSLVNSSDLVYVIDDAIRTLGVLLIFYGVGARVSISTFSQLVLITFWISSFLVVVEVINGAPIHSSIAAGLALDSNGNISGERGIRAQALFDGPLFFAEYLILVFAMFLYRAKNFSIVERFAFSLVFIAIVALNGSRSLVVTVVAMIFIWSALHYWRATTNCGRLFLGAIAFVIIVAAAWLTGQYIFQIGASSNVENMAELGAFERSSTARAFQFFQVAEFLRGHAFLGTGFKRHFVGEEGMLSLDNYYIRLLLESGFFGFAIFAFFFFTLSKKLLKALDCVRLQSSKRLITMILTLTFGTLIFRFFFQDPLGWVLYYSVLGVSLRCLAESEKLARGQTA